MERWIPLFDIFLNSPSPEGEASLWMQQQLQQTQSPFFSTSAFLSLLLRHHDTNRCMWIQTLPTPIQSRILSFLRTESHRFSTERLRILAINILNTQSQHHQGLDFWVEKAARNLLDKISPRSTTTPIHNIYSNSIKDGNSDEGFTALPDWLQNHAAGANSVLPWLPISLKNSDMKVSADTFLSGKFKKPSIVEIAAAAAFDDDDGDEEGLGSNESAAIQIETGCIPALDAEILSQAAVLKSQLLGFSSAPETISLANGILQLCSDTRVGDASVVLGLIEPWEADDESTSILLSHLLVGREDRPNWSSQVLSAVVLPKLLVLQNPASRLLATATIEFCKLHQKAAVDAILLPVILRKEGINTPLCDLLTRIIKECLRLAHVSAFCQKLLCEEDGARSFKCLPCHLCLVSSKLVWTEPLFSLFQNILNLNVCLTPDSVDCIVSQLNEIADRFSKSLKFGNFLLCFVSKCARSLTAHRFVLMKMAEKTDTFMTKSLLSKLSAL